MQFKLPAPKAIIDLTMSDGAQVRVRRHGNGNGPRLVMSHGNGFAIDAYFPFWGLLLRDFDIVIYDQRNHGWNPRHDKRGHTQRQMADDMATILSAISAQFGNRPTSGLFHSLSTTVSLLHTLYHGFSWHSLILLDPPLAAPEGHRLQPLTRAFDVGLSEWARQRTERFASAAELANYFKGTRRMSVWVPGAAELMAKSITRPAPDGGVRLVCPGEFEAEIYLQNSKSQAWSAVPAIAKDVFIVSSDPNVANPDPPGLVAQALHDEYGVGVITVPNSGHLLHIEVPEVVGKIVCDLLLSRGFV